MTRVGGRYFLVERYTPSTSVASIEAASARLTDTHDPDVRHVVTLVVPDEETCLSVFEASAIEGVEVFNRRVEFPLDRIVEVRLLSGRPSPGPRSLRARAGARRTRLTTSLAGHTDLVPQAEGNVAPDPRGPEIGAAHSSMVSC